MNAITDATATNPYLVKIMPGVYNIGSNSVRMKPYVDIEGSGENVTIVSGSNFSVVNGGSNTEISSLTVRSGNPFFFSGFRIKCGMTTKVKGLLF